MSDQLTIGGKTFTSRLMTGTGKHRSPEDLVASVEASGTEIITGGTVTTSLTGVSIPSFTVGTIPAGNWIWLETTNVGGTVDELAVVPQLAGVK